MKIKHNKPLVYPLLKLFFPSLDWEKAIITLGDTIYSKNPISEAKKVHEQVHIDQQKKDKLYLIKYILSDKYRLNSELEAYRAEYQFSKQGAGEMATILSGPLYKNIINYEEALKEICGFSKQ